MKFLIIAPRFHTNLYYRALALQQAGNQVKVLVLYKGKSEFYDDIDISKLELSFLSNFILSIINIFKKTSLKSNFELRIQAPNKILKKTILSYNPDVILLKAYQDILAVKTLLATRKLKTKILMLTQTPYAHIKNSKLLFKINMWVFKKLGVHSYITPIKINYDVFRKAGVTNVYYLPFVYPPATNLETKKSIKKQGSLQIISVGKFVKRKDQLLLIKACHELIKKKYSIRLSIYGEIADIEYYKSLINYIRKNGLQDRMELKTNFPYKKLVTLYKNYDLFVLPSFSEPAAYSPVEALANGLPIILSDQCGTKCYIKDGVNGSIFKAKSLDDLTNCILSYLIDLNRIIKMKTNSLVIAKKKHSLKSFSKKILEIIEE